MFFTFFFRKISVKKKKVNVNLAFNVIVAAVECYKLSSRTFPLSKYSYKLPIYL